MDSGNKHKPCEDAVPSGDVPIAILTHQIMDETDDAKKAALEHQLLKELQVMELNKIIIVTAKYFICSASCKYPINDAQDCN